MGKTDGYNFYTKGSHRSGLVLLVTLVLLMVLSILGYTITSRVCAQKRRAQYIIDYQSARYGCDSAVKYALAQLEGLAPKLIARPNVPDFSDLFHLSEPEYQAMLEEVAALKASEAGADTNDMVAFANDANITDANLAAALGGLLDVSRSNDVNAINDVNMTAFTGGLGGAVGANTVVIPGPYGPAWPYVIEPIELEIGTARVKIEIEDENAKYPLGWLLMENREVEREIRASFETFCEWMDVNDVEISVIEDQLEQVKQIKPFKVEFKDVTKRKLVTTTSRSKDTRGRRSLRRRPIRRYTTVRVSAAKQIAEQAADFAQLLHTSLIDTEILARPTIASETRRESPLKYIGMWGSTRVNINTAPRQVLEAVFTFGGDAVNIAQGIIERRRIEPFKDIADLKQALFEYSDSIRRCEKYITTESSFFTIRVTAVSGLARASTVIAVTKTKDDKKANVIAIIPG